MSGPVLPLILQAIEALKLGQRRAAAALLRKEAVTLPDGSARWPSVSRLASEIGEIELAIDTARRAAASGSLEAHLNYWATLGTYGRTEEALAHVGDLPRGLREQPAVLHFQATIAGEKGEFQRAEDLFRQALARAPDAMQIWFGLAMIKAFGPADGDIESMQALLDRAPSADSDAKARLLYALGKAWDDVGEPDRAFSYVTRGAAMKKRLEPYDSHHLTPFFEQTLRDFTADSLARLRTSQGPTQRSLFVTGLPRSGTTLAQQMLAAHSSVSDGAELNFMRPALIPTIDYTMAGALTFQARSVGSDPWGGIAADYRRFVDVRFPSTGLIVDKSLNQSLLMGLLLHSLPDARIVWMRRRPEDAALSCFRTYFTALPWTWSLTDIGTHFRNEDRLFEHWRDLFPDRILEVRYEELTQDPRRLVPAMLRHFGLAEEEQVYDFHLKSGNVRTASVRQVRAPLSSARVGAAEAYAKHLEPFQRAYLG